MTIDLPPDLLADIIAHPDDDTLRLIAADWFEEHGELERAEFIRLQILMFNRRKSPGGQADEKSPWIMNDREYQGWKRREKTLSQRNRNGWVMSLEYATKLPFLSDTHTEYLRPGCVSVAFHRGFIEELTCSWEDWSEHSDSILQQQPIRKVMLTTWPELGFGTEEKVRRAWPGIEFELPPPGFPVPKEFGNPRNWSREMEGPARRIELPDWNWTIPSLGIPAHLLEGENDSSPNS